MHARRTFDIETYSAVCQSHSVYDEELSVSTFASKHIESMCTTSSHIEIMHSAFLEKTQKVLVFVLLGQTSLPDNLCQEHMSLEYYTGLDELSVQNSVYIIDKIIYNTIVVLSISLLVFLVLQHRLWRMITARVKRQHCQTCFPQPGHDDDAF
jgi:hypothetical protein